MPPDEQTAATLNSMPNGGIHREIQKLGIALAGLDDFRLYLAIWHTVAVRDDCIAWLTDRYKERGERLVCIDLQAPSPESELVSRLGLEYRHANEGFTGRIALMVINLDQLLGSRGAESRRLLVTANLHRDRLPAVCPAPIVLWLTPEASVEFATHAPDLWHWRSATFEFTASPQPVTATHQAPSPRVQEQGDVGLALSVQEAEAHLESLRKLPSAETPRVRAQIARAEARLGQALYRRGDWDRALQLLRSAVIKLGALGEERDRADTLGWIADILVGRGDYEEALRILREEQLPVFIRLRDERERADTLGKIADVIQAQGDVTEALRIRTQEQLPVVERLGDARRQAATHARIADLLTAQGRLEEALRKLQSEVLPAFQQDGAESQRAATYAKIADILVRRGQREEALRLLGEEVVPVFDGIGAEREAALACARIARLLDELGAVDRAEQVWWNNVVAPLERLDARRDLAIARWNLADLLRRRNRRDESREQAERALKDAQAMQLPEAYDIENWIHKYT